MPFLCRKNALFLLFSIICISCSRLSNRVDSIKVQCKTNTVDTNRSYVAIVDSQGTVLRATEFAVRWLDDAGSPQLNGQCLELDKAEQRSLILRSRLGAEGLIYATATAKDGGLAQAQLEKYNYGPLRKTCDEAINTNLLNVGLPISFGDLAASGYTIKAIATQENQERQRWEFINAGSAVPNLDLAALDNGRYALHIDLDPLFSEGAVTQSFNCDLTVDRKIPQIALLSADGGQLTSRSIEIQPGSRIGWKNAGKISEEFLEYCFVSEQAGTNECPTPSVSNDLIVAPNQGAWRLLYRGMDAARNASDWAALDLAVVDELKLADIRNKLELARFYQKSGQTQFVAIHLLEALETWKNLPTELERARVKKDLDIAIFQHQWDARDTLVQQWDEKENIDYLVSLNPPDGETVHVFSRTIDFTRKGLNFIVNGKPLMPEVAIGNSLFASCGVKDLVTYIEDKQLKLFDGKTVKSLQVDKSRDLTTVKGVTFSEDCRFVHVKDSFDIFLFDLDRDKTITFEPSNFPNHWDPMNCPFNFALGQGDGTKYFGYCRVSGNVALRLYAVDAKERTLSSASWPTFLTTKIPLQVMAWQDYVFIVTEDKSFGVFNKDLGSHATKESTTQPGQQTEGLVFDRARQRLLVVGPFWAVTPGTKPYRSFDAYTYQSGNSTAPWQVARGEFHIDGQVHIGKELMVSQQIFNSSSSVPDLFVTRTDKDAYFFGQLPIDRDTLQFLDARDQALLRSAGNRFRGLSPNESLLRRTTRLQGGELTVVPIDQDVRTVLFTCLVDGERDLLRSEFSPDAAFISLLKVPPKSIAKPLLFDVSWQVYPYGSEPLIRQMLADREQFHIRDTDGNERTTLVNVPRSLPEIPTNDPDLLWRFVPAEGNIYLIRASTGTALPSSSFRTVAAPFAPLWGAPLRMHIDFYENTLYVIYANYILQVRFNGSLDDPQFTSAEKIDLKTPFKDIVPMGGFKKWMAVKEDSLSFYDGNGQLLDTLKAKDVFGPTAQFKENLVAVVDQDTLISGRDDLSRIEISKKQATTQRFGRRAETNVIKSMSVDAQNRLNYRTDGELFRLPLNLSENEAHLCRYLSGLGVGLYPELKERFEKTACGKK